MLAETVGDHITAAGHYQEATTGWRTYGHTLELAHALAGQARCLTALGHPDQAAPTATEAASILQSLGVRGRAPPSLPSRP
jgi:hypothetical protein